MAHIISSKIVVAHSHCPWKAFLLFRADDQGTPHEYVRLIEEVARCNRVKYLKGINKDNSGVNHKSATDLTLGEEVLVYTPLSFLDLEADCCLLYKASQSSSLGSFSYTPTIFVGTVQVTAEQKLALSFAGYVLGKIQNCCLFQEQSWEPTAKPTKYY